MKIRLGNDIRLKIQLPVGNTAEDNASILSARAFFVNTTLKEELKKKYIKKNRFIGRFPIEPFVDEFEPTQYNINCSGFPKYRVFVHNEYKGFGLHPDWKETLPVRDVNITTYESTIEYTAERGTVIVDFPASAQKYAGVYELIVIAQVYDAGYANNSRTVTINSNNVFELVESTEQQEDVDNPINLEIDRINSDTTSDDIYVVAGTYKNNNITLTRNDGGNVRVNVDPKEFWYYDE